MSAARALLRLRSFRLLWSGHVVANFGDALTSLALVLLAYRLTGSAAAVAGVAIALALPQLLVGLPAGVLVDRWDRRRVMIASDLVRAVLVLGFLLVLSSGSLLLLYLLAFLQAAAGSFFNPARGALLADLVPANQLLPANSLSETGRVVASVLGVAAAGAIAGMTGSLGLAFVVTSATFVASAALVAGVRTAPPARAAAPPSGIWTELLEGASPMLRSRRLLGVLVAATIVMFGLAAANVLVVPFVVDTLDASEAWFGPLRGALVTSMILAGALLTLVAGRLRPTTLISAGLAGIGLGVALIATATDPWHLLVLYFAVGWFVTPVQASVTTILQTEVPPRSRGRAQATFATTVGGASLLSIGLAGAAADAVGIRLVFVLCGIVALTAAIASAAVFRSAVPTRPKGESMSGIRHPRRGPATDDSPHVTFRLLSPDESNHIKWALYQAVSWNPDRQLPPLEVLIDHPELARYHRDWGRPGDVGVVAEVDARRTGVAFCRLFTDHDHGHGYVDQATPELAIAVEAAYRGRGIGARLMHELADRARTAGFARLSLSVDADNPALRLYERLGYSELTRDEGGVRMLIELSERPNGDLAGTVSASPHRT